MKYMSLDQRGRIQAEYIWIDAVGGTRSKTKVRTALDICMSWWGWCWRCLSALDKPWISHATPATIRVT